MFPDVKEIPVLIAKDAEPVVTDRDNTTSGTVAGSPVHSR